MTNGRGKNVRAEKQDHFVSNVLIVSFLVIIGLRWRHNTSKHLIDRLGFNAIFNSISVISQWPVHLFMLLQEILVTSTPNNILFKRLAAFQRNHCRINEQRWERNESCRHDYHKSSESNIDLARDQTSDLLFSSPVGCKLSYGAGHNVCAKEDDHFVSYVMIVSFLVVIRLRWRQSTSKEIE